jgi:hypothetical protein
VFEPSIVVAPETTETDSPSGYVVDVRVPQSANVPGDLATPNMRDVVLSFPAGTSVSPSAANGLVACKASGPEGIELGSGDLLADGNRVQEGEEVGPDGLVHPAVGHCPAASEIGEVEAVTPLLGEPLRGHLFVAEPGCGGEGQAACTPASASDGELFGVYLEAAGSGLVIKLKGEAQVNPVSGQITTRFQGVPDEPVSEVKIRLNGGQRAPLANPQTCGGQFEATSDLTPWSTPYTPDATPRSTFPITGCTGAFSPSFEAGTVNNTAGAFSGFTLSLGRRDGEGDLGGLAVGMPLGLLARVAGVPLCGEAAADAGSCPVGSRVGTVTASAGAGADPFWQSGPVFLTGPYNGGPFGLSVVVPAKAGPYDLGDVVVRASIRINPVTAAVSVVSNPLPQMVDGVPLRVQTVNVTVGGEDDFTFNPTNCVQQQVTGVVSSVGGQSVSVASPFAAAGCSGLPFKPVLSASTAGGSSKADGASLVVRIATKSGEANIAKTDLQLPLVLPSRLTTLQKACTEAQFNTDPAGCPEGSDIGVATAKTPVLNVPLTGPMYLVSHGGAAFPDVEIVLQGEGVQIVLDGKTDIKKGVTYSNFETVPDAPVSSFEADLPEGPHSAFTTEFPGVTNLCALRKTVIVTVRVKRRVGGKLKSVSEKVKRTEPESLVMPTRIVGQNGAVVTQNTKITVTGCTKTPAKNTAGKAGRRASKASGGAGS